MKTADQKQLFREKLAQYKALIDKDIDDYAKTLESSIAKRYGDPAKEVVKVYTSILSRRGKRIRGVLTIVGYEMCGGQDLQMVVKAARAVEMMHAYMLIIDDIQDRADLRRGGPSAHRWLEERHNSLGWRASPEHTGVSLALNAALLGSHGAQIVLSELDVPVDLKLKAISILNYTMIVTAHGQTHDIVNEISQNVTEQSVENVMQWKTAHYTVLNPLHMGMVLAGAGCEDTNAITEYALNLGKAFQITDDMLVMSNDEETGKNPKDDIREGKQTLLTVYALKNANTKDAEFLKNSLGAANLSDSDFRRCQEILDTSGAYKYAQDQAKKYIDLARKSLQQHQDLWSSSSTDFLHQLANYLLNRSK